MAKRVYLQIVSAIEQDGKAFEMNGSKLQPFRVAQKFNQGGTVQLTNTLKFWDDRPGQDMITGFSYHGIRKLRDKRSRHRL